VHGNALRVLQAAFKSHGRRKGKNTSKGTSFSTRKKSGKKSSWQMNIIQERGAYLRPIKKRGRLQTALQGPGGTGRMGVNITGPDHRGGSDEDIWKSFTQEKRKTIHRDLSSQKHVVQRKESQIPQLKSTPKRGNYERKAGRKGRRREPGGGLLYPHTT